MASACHLGHGHGALTFCFSLLQLEFEFLQLGEESLALFLSGCLKLLSGFGQGFLEELLFLFCFLDGLLVLAAGFLLFSHPGFDLLLFFLVTASKFLGGHGVTKLLEYDF